MKRGTSRASLLSILYFTGPGLIYGQLGHRVTSMRSKIIIFLLSLSIVPSIGFSQASLKMTESKLDSLRALSKSTSVHDSISIKASEEIAVQFQDRNLDSAGHYAMIALKKSVNKNFKRQELKALNRLTQIAIIKGDLAKAFQYCLKAEKLCQQLNFTKEMNVTLISRGDIYKHSNNYKNAVKCYLTALKYFEEHNDEKFIGICNFYLGLVYYDLGDRYKSYFHYDNALQVAKKNGYTVMHAALLVNIYTLLDSAAKIKEGGKYLDEALAIYTKDDNKSGVMHVLLNYASLFLKKGEYDQALSYAHQSEKLVQHTKQMTHLKSIYRTIASIYKSKREYHQAIDACIKGLYLSSNPIDVEDMVAFNGDLAENYESLGLLKKALFFAHEHSRWKDSLFSFEKFSKINSLETSYAIEKEQAKIEGLEKENLLKTEIANQRLEKIRYLTLSAGLLTLSAGLLFVRYRQKSKWASALSKKNQIIESQNKEISDKNNVLESLNNELREKAFRAQINPHFIFNSLNSIQYLITQKNPKDACEYLTKFSLLLRKTLEYSDKTKIGVREEIEILALYLQLESLRFEDGLKYEIETEPNLQDKIAIPPMTIQPVVENAIVHGLLHKKGERKLSIKFSEKDRKVLCTVTDNGIGREKALRLKEKKGILFKSWGMKITEQRIAVQNTLMKENSSYSVEDLIDEGGNPSGTCVTLAFDNG